MPLSTQPTVKLREARGPDLCCIENMMQFYNYELSRWYPIEFDSAGLFAIRSKTDYWANPRVVPYLIRVDDKLAGFAVIDDEVLHSQSEYSLGYFFVARRYRGRGVGTSAFKELLHRFPGAWEVYHLAQNEAAARFWPLALQQAHILNATVSEEVIHGDASIMRRFMATVAT
jgi:predicted acetyltransferase